MKIDAGETAAAGESVVDQLSTLDRFLPVWIFLAMGVGLALGGLVPGLATVLSAVAIGGTSLPIAIALLLMMYPVLARVRYEDLGRMKGERGLLVSSLVINWLIGPALMFALAWLLLPDEPAYRTGLIVVGLARCIAMVLVWSELACADREATAVLVAINSLFQIVAYSLLGYFYLSVLPGWLGLDSEGISVGIWEVARTVLIFLGIPLAAGLLTRVVGIRRRGVGWYEQTFLPRISPITLYGLLFTIVLLFVLQGHQITTRPVDVIRIALPLLAYFVVMFTIAFAWGKASGYGYPRTATLALTAASNNFELAIAVAIGVFGETSGEALAGVVGPLIEVPVLVGLVYVSLWARRRWFAVSAPTDPPSGRRLANA
jgi:ACR3 family arsenite transporter